VDAIEVFNARCLSNIYNQRAQTFAKKNGLLQTAGSDAHSLWELGRATMLMPQFDDPESFKEALRESDIDGKRSSPLVHFFSRYAVFVKHLRSLTN
jgi:predicted metal-dependent phosphoesterase TrpH